MRTMAKRLTAIAVLTAALGFTGAGASASSSGTKTQTMSVSIIGSSYAAPGCVDVWTAVVEGGTPPYTYNWTPAGGYADDPQYYVAFSGDEAPYPAYLDVLVTDANNEQVWDRKIVSVSSLYPC